MNTTLSNPSVHADFTVLLMLSRLLDRLEGSAVPVDPGQYRSVVQRLSQALETAEPGPLLKALLAEHPSAAALYENLNYRHAGLIRSPLDLSLSSELAAKDALARAAGQPRKPPPL
jgi:hypothetical protein